MRILVLVSGFILALVLLGCGGATHVRTVPRGELTDPESLDDLGAGLVLPSDQPLPPGRMRVHVINVGQGAATLLEFACGAVLVDTGGESSGSFDGTVELEAYLDHFFDRRADLSRHLAAVYLTHPHIDHTRGVRRIIEGYSVDNLITNGRPNNASGNPYSGGRQQAWAEAWALQREQELQAQGVDDRVVLRRISTGDIDGSAPLHDTEIDPIDCGNSDPEIAVLWGGIEAIPAGWSAEVADEANNHSLVIRVSLGEFSMLITGDLEHEGIDALIERWNGHAAALDVAVLQVGHHGSANGVSQAFLARTTPVVGVIAMGDPTRQVSWSAWQYGHPRRSIVSMVAGSTTRTRSPVDVMVGDGARRFSWLRLDRAVYGTGWDGSIVIGGDADGDIRVTTEY